MIKESNKEYFMNCNIELKNYKLNQDEYKRTSQLVCRLCERKIHLQKFLAFFTYNNYQVHTELCMKRIEFKDKYQKLDDSLLDYGENITGNIRDLSKKVYFCLLILVQENFT